MQSHNLRRQAQAARCFIGALLLISAFAGTAAAQALHYTPATPPPRYEAEPLALQIALGTALGGAGFYAGAHLGGSLSSCDGNFVCDITGTFIGFSVGLTAVSALGVWLGGQATSTPVDYRRALTGSLVGYAGALAFIGALKPDGEVVMLVPLFALPAVGAALSGTTGPRYRHGDPVRALVNVDGEQFIIGVPQLQQQPLMGLPQTFERSVRLLEVRW